MSDKDIFNKAKQIFLSWYEEIKSVPYYFTAKDAGSLKQLLTKIKYVGSKKHAGEGLEWVIDAFKWILSNLDEWTKKHSTIPIINSRFNEILANGKQQNASKDREYLTDLARRLGE